MRQEKSFLSGKMQMIFKYYDEEKRLSLKNQLEPVESLSFLIISNTFSVL